MEDIMSTAVLVNTSPSIALGEKREDLAKELKRLLPGLDQVLGKLSRIEERYCKPLLLVEPRVLEESFKHTLPLFMVDLAYVMMPLSYNLFVEAEEKRNISALVKLKELEKSLFKKLRPLLGKAAREKRVNPELVVKIHAAAIDYDLWLIDMVMENGFHGFIQRLVERASNIGGDFVWNLYALFYTMMSIDLALLGEAPYKEDTLRILVEWGSNYANEVEDYLDTLIFLIPDEEYQVIAEFMQSEAP